MLNLVQYENKQGYVHTIQDKCFENSQIHLLTIMYHFEQTNHDILLNSYFKIFTNSFMFK